MGPGRLLAFVKEDLDEGPILLCSGAFIEEIRECGYNIADHNMPAPNCHGLLVFEGFIEHTRGPDPDVMWLGEWRQLTHWELCRLRYGLNIFLEDK